MMTRSDEHQRDAGYQHDDRERREAENEDERYLRDIGYQPNVNQVRHEPIPASDHAERGQLGEVRNEDAVKPAAAHQQRKSHEQSSPDRESTDQRPGRRPARR